MHWRGILVKVEDFGLSIKDKVIVDFEHFSWHDLAYLALDTPRRHGPAFHVPECISLFKVSRDTHQKFTLPKLGEMDLKNGIVVLPICSSMGPVN